MRARRSPLFSGLVLTAMVGLAGVGVLAAPVIAKDARSQGIRDSAITGQQPGKRTVMVVGNNWAGTATMVDAHTHDVLTTINIAPPELTQMLDTQMLDT